MRRVMGAVGTVILEILKWILRIILGALKLVLGLARIILLLFAMVARIFLSFVRMGTWSNEKLNSTCSLKNDLYDDFEE